MSPFTHSTQGPGHVSTLQQPKSRPPGPFWYILGCIQRCLSTSANLLTSALVVFISHPAHPSGLFSSRALAATILLPPPPLPSATLVFAVVILYYLLSCVFSSPGFILFNDSFFLSFFFFTRIVRLARLVRLRRRYCFDLLFSYCWPQVICQSHSLTQLISSDDTHITPPRQRDNTTTPTTAPTTATTTTAPTTTLTTNNNLGRHHSHNAALHSRPATTSQPTTRSHHFSLLTSLSGSASSQWNLPARGESLPPSFMPPLRLPPRILTPNITSYVRPRPAPSRAALGLPRLLTTSASSLSHSPRCASPQPAPRV